MNLPSYKSTLTSKKDADAELVDIKVEQAEARLTLKIAEVKEDLTTRKLAQAKVLVSGDIDFDQIVDLQGQIEDIEANLAAHQDIKTQMFPSA